MFWWVNYLSDYSDFDFLWEPVPWEAHQRHAWASQWQKDCGTYLVPKVDYKDTNYHTQQIPRRAGVPVYEIDHMVQLDRYPTLFAAYAILTTIKIL